MAHRRGVMTCHHHYNHQQKYSPLSIAKWFPQSAGWVSRLYFWAVRSWFFSPNSSHVYSSIRRPHASFPSSFIYLFLFHCAAAPSSVRFFFQNKFPSKNGLIRIKTKRVRERWKKRREKTKETKTRPDTRHKMRLLCVLFTFENNTGPTDGSSDGPRDGRTDTTSYRNATAHLKRGKQEARKEQGQK